MDTRTKLVLSFLFAVVVSIGSVMGLVYWKTNQAALEDSKQATVGQLTRVNAYIESFFLQTQENSLFLSGTPEVIAAYDHVPLYATLDKPTTVTREQMAPAGQVVDTLFAAMRAAHSMYAGIYMGYDNGRFLETPAAAWPAGFDPRKRPWYMFAQQAPGNLSTTEAYSTPQGVPVCAVTSKIFREGKQIGILGIDIKLDSIVQFVSSVRLGDTGYLMLIEKNSMVLVDPLKKDRVFTKIADSNDQTLKAAFAMKNGSMMGTIDGIPRLITVYTGYNGWKLLGIMDESEVYAQSQAMMYSIMYIGLGVAVLLVLLSMLLAMGITKPINRLVLLSRDIADGKISTLPAQSGFTGELGVLYQSLSAMVSRLATMVSSAENQTRDAENLTQQAREALQQAEASRIAADQAQAEGIAQAADQLGVIVLRTSQTSKAIMGSAQGVYDKSMTQRNRAMEASAAMGEMNAAVRDVASGASRAAENAEVVRCSAEQGGNLVRSVEQSIEEVVRVSQQLDTQLALLGERAQDISRIMVMISDVADQTNLLALNAAIEAARAGDAGRGFAVVADEVRKLAEKTMSATGEVSDVVQAIRTGADASIKDMRDVTGHVERSRSLALDAGESLRNIVNLIQESAEQVRSIATASEQQSASSTEITRNMEAVTAQAVDIAEAMVGARQAVGGLVTETAEMEKVIARLKKR